MGEFIKGLLLSEFVFGALVSVVVWVAISAFEKNKFLSKALPYIVETFRFVEEKAKEAGVKGEQKWVLFLRLFIETYEKKYGVMEVKELSALKQVVNGIAKKQEKALPLLIEKHGDEAIRNDLFKVEKTITF